MWLLASTLALQPSYAALSEKWHGPIKVHTLVVLTASAAYKVGHPILGLSRSTLLISLSKATIVNRVLA